MRNPLLLHILFFMQLQWFSVLAGILVPISEYENCYEKAMVDASVYNHTPSCHSNSLQCITNLPDDLRSFDQRHSSRIRRYYLLHVWCFFILLATSKLHPSHIALGGLLGGLILFSWQRILLHRYWSVEWFMLFLLRVFA